MSTFGLYRIVGNDLEPRQSKGQSLINTRFILENEPNFENVTKIFVLNRILDQDLREQIRELVESHGHQALVIPFVEDEYRRLCFDTQSNPYLSFIISMSRGQLSKEQEFGWTLGRDEKIRSLLGLDIPKTEINENKKPKKREEYRRLKSVLKFVSERWGINHIGHVTGLTSEINQYLAFKNAVNEPQTEKAETPAPVLELMPELIDLNSERKRTYQKIDLSYDKIKEFHRVSAQLASLRFKNNYIMNNNGARNFALFHGRSRYEWTLPWDGNCILTKELFEEISAGVSRYRGNYIYIPMIRMEDNAQFGKKWPVSTVFSEPQLGFRRNTSDKFSELFWYGHLPKVEMLWHLGVKKGDWDRWRAHPWDPDPRAQLSLDIPAKKTGCVLRLASGKRNDAAKEINGDLKNDRDASIFLAVAKEDERTKSDNADILYDISDRKIALFEPDLNREVGTCLDRKVLTVLDKRLTAPSGNKNDYFHPSPYYWPNPDTSDGLPLIRKDGQRNPATILGTEESFDYDRTALQQMMDGLVYLSISYRSTGSSECLSKISEILRKWFLDPETSVNPNLKWAQFREQANSGGFIHPGTGMIEIRDMGNALAALLPLKEGGAVLLEEFSALDAWLSEFVEYLENSEEGIKEKTRSNNHGISFDMLVLAFSIFMDDKVRMQRTFIRAQSRLDEHFDQWGLQPHELVRTTSKHYAVFNLQLWIKLLQLGRAKGLYYPNEIGSPWIVLRQALLTTFELFSKPWLFEQIEEFDEFRLGVLAILASDLDLITLEESKLSPDVIAEAIKRTEFSPHYSIAPLWQFGVSNESLLEQYINY